MEESRQINITGTNNKYMVKKFITNNKEVKNSKKRMVSEKWVFSEEYYNYTYQIKAINEIIQNNYIHLDDVSKIIIQEINKKIASYKQQDIIKKRFDAINFLTFETVMQKMIESELKCRYCNCEMSVLYDLSREMKQWSVDRINNDKGHNNENFHLACLECNLKRRRITDEKFLFTKQLNIVREDY
jgi:hypothetical protein